MKNDLIFIEHKQLTDHLQLFYKCHLTAVGELTTQYIEENVSLETVGKGVKLMFLSLAKATKCD